MHSSKLLIITLASVSICLASPLTTVSTRQTKTNASTVLNDLQALTTNIKTLNNTLNEFKPNDLLSTFTALQIEQQTSKITTTLKSAISSTQHSSNFTLIESSQIANQTNATLRPVFKSLLSNIVMHKPSFSTAVGTARNLSRTMEQSLREQRVKTKMLGDALGEKLADPYARFAPAVTRAMVGDFDKAIQEYRKL